MFNDFKERIEQYSFFFIPHIWLNLEIVGAHFQLMYFTSLEDKGQDTFDVILLGILQARKMT